MLRSFVLSLLAVAGLQAQPELQDKVYNLQNISGRSIQELRTLVGVMAGIPEDGIQADLPQNRLVVHARQDQVDLTSWIVSQLDQPASALPALRKTHPQNAGVRIYFIANADSVRAFQEMATVVRSIAEIRALYTFQPLQAIAVRANDDQARLSDFLFAAIDQPAAVESGMTSGPEDVTRLIPIQHAESVQAFQEMATAIRSITDIRRAFTYNQTRTLALRGTMAEIQLARWLLTQIDRATPLATTTQYSASAFKEDPNVEVLFLKPTLTVPEFQKNVTEMRVQTGTRRVYSYNPLRAVLIRGTTDQLAQAEKTLIQ